MAKSSEVPCGRPGCNTKFDMEGPRGEVILSLERRIDGPLAVNVDCLVCAGCSNDLADFWLLGKKA
jgi:hypothetical protein